MLLYAPALLINPFLLYNDTTENSPERQTSKHYKRIRHLNDILMSL